MADYSDAQSAAIAALEADPTPGSGTEPALPTEPATPDPAPASATPDPSAAPDAPAADSDHAASPDPSAPATSVAKVTFEHGGKTYEMTPAELAEARDAGLRLADYTRKTQEVAEQRRQFQAALPELQRISREREALLHYWNDPAQLQQRLQALQQGQSQTPATAEPPGQQTADDLLTVSQAQAMWQQQLQRATQQQQAAMEQRLAQERAQFEYERETAANADLFDQTIDALAKDFPELQHTYGDDLGALLKSDAEKVSPTTSDEAVTAIRNAARVRVDRIKAWLGEQSKQTAIEQSKLARGIEPPGGSGVIKAPKKYKLGDEELTAAAAHFLETGQLP